MSPELGSGRRNSDDPRGTFVSLRNMLTVTPNHEAILTGDEDDDDMDEEDLEEPLD